MSIITLVVGICVILFACWLASSYMPAPWKTPTLVVIVLLGLFWLATIFVPGLSSMRVGS